MDLLDASWKLLLMRGAIGVLFGIVAIAWPISTVIVLVVLWGVWALVDGIGLGLSAFRDGSTGERVLAGLVGVLAVLAGLYAIVHPGRAATALTWVVGLWLLARGVFELIGAFAGGLPGAVRAMMVVSALVDFLLGGIFVAHPGKSAVGIATFVGIVALIWGVVLVVLAFVVRRQVKDLASDPPVGDRLSPRPVSVGDNR